MKSKPSSILIRQHNATARHWKKVIGLPSSTSVIDVEVEMLDIILLSPL